jgi:predicted thioredoxin/glutaredoxin
MDPRGSFQQADPCDATLLQRKAYRASGDRQEWIAEMLKIVAEDLSRPMPWLEIRPSLPTGKGRVVTTTRSRGAGS